MDKIWQEVQDEVDRVCPENGLLVGGDPEFFLKVLRSLPDGAGQRAVVRVLEELNRRRTVDDGGIV
jgi:hypothetical protein